MKEDWTDIYEHEQRTEKVLTIGSIAVFCIVTLFVLLLSVCVMAQPLTLRVYENIATDRSGNGNDGYRPSTIYNPILYDGYAKFGESSDYDHYYTNIKPAIGTVSNLSLLVWIYPTNSSGSIWGNGSLHFTGGGGGGFGFRISTSTQYTNGYIEANTTNVIAYVWDCTNTYSVYGYKNGVYYLFRSNYSNDWYGYQNDNIGNRQTGNSLDYNGYAYDIRLYYRTITSNEYLIYKSYCDAGLTMPKDAISTNDLIAWYDFNRDSKSLRVTNEFGAKTLRVE